MEFINFLNKILYYLDPVAWLIRLWEFIQDVFYWTMQAIVDLAASILSTVTMPVFSIPSIEGTIPFYVLSAMNWVIPFGFLFQCAGVIIFSTAMYFTVGVIMRWLKVVS
jgi:hypothetical protein